MEEIPHEGDLEFTSVTICMFISTKQHSRSRETVEFYDINLFILGYAILLILLIKLQTVGENTISMPDVCACILLNRTQETSDHIA
jgi:hypothetical protein